MIKTRQEGREEEKKLKEKAYQYEETGEKYQRVKRESERDKKKERGGEGFQTLFLIYRRRRQKKKERTRQKNMCVVFTIHITYITYITFALTRKMFLVD